MKRGVNKIFSRQGSGAYMQDAVVDASKGMQKRNVARPIIVVLTVEEGVEFSNIRHDAALKELQKSGAVLHILAIGQPNPSQEDEMRSRQIFIAEGTRQTGGRAFFPTSVGELPGIYQQISEELANQYSLAYSSRNTSRNGAWRRLVVRLTRPGLQPRTRLGYFAPSATQ